MLRVCPAHKRGCQDNYVDLLRFKRFQNSNDCYRDRIQGKRLFIAVNLGHNYEEEAREKKHKGKLLQARYQIAYCITRDVQ